MLFGSAAATAEENHGALQGLRSTTAAPLAVPPLRALEEEEEVEDEMRSSTVECEMLHDSHGQWKGSRRVGGAYSLSCRPGYAVTNNRGPHVEIKCHSVDGVLAWPDKPSCYNINDCDGLRWGCGAFGMCMDDVEGYTCNCEKGRARKKYGNETICGDVKSCGGKSCGAYGVCVESTKVNWKCECADGFWFDNTSVTCIRRHCTPLRNESGTWSGSTSYGEHYTLTCDEQSFVRGHERLKTITTSCDWSGAIADWPNPEPTCENLYREALEAAAEARKRSLFTLGVLCCVTCAALAAGLTLGVAGLQPFSLKVILATQPEHIKDKDKQECLKLQAEQRSAEKVLPLVQDHHRLLITLMMFNTLANEALPIFLEDLVPSWAAVLISVSLVLIFCEVIPSAIFTGPSQLRIAGFFAPFIKFLEWILTYPSWPIIKLLHYLVPHDDHEGDVKYTRAELRAIIRKQGDDFVTPLPDEHTSRPNVGGSEVFTWLLRASQDPASSDRLSNPLTDNPEFAGVAETHATTHHAEAAAPILSRAELQQINGALGLHRVTLNQVDFTKRRQCLMAGGHETPQDVLSQLHSGYRVVLLLRDGVQQRTGFVTAAMVHRILWPADLLTGEASLGDINCGMPVPLSEDIKVLDALKQLESHCSSSGLVLAKEEDGGGVKGAIRAQDLLAAVLCSKELESIGQAKSDGEDRFAQDRYPRDRNSSWTGTRGGVRLMTRGTGGAATSQPLSTPRITSLEPRGQYRPLP